MTDTDELETLTAVPAVLDWMFGNAFTPDEARDMLRDSVRRYRDPATTEERREIIRGWWSLIGVPNQFAAMLHAAEIDHTKA